MRLHGTTLSGQVFEHLSVQVFNLPRKRTSAGQIFVRYRVNANRNKYLYEFVLVSCLKATLANMSFKAIYMLLGQLSFITSENMDPES